VQALFPLCRVDDILAGFYVKEDGRANPVDVTMSLAKVRVFAPLAWSCARSPG
jgi:hypothetical protein